MPDRWVHEYFDWLTLGESLPEVHKFKDSPSQFPSVGSRHRVLRHNEWREWARLWAIPAQGPLRVLELGPRQLLGSWAEAPMEDVPETLHQAWLQFAISVGHEAADSMWSELPLDNLEKSQLELVVALILLQDDRWEEAILRNRRFRSLQEYVLWGILPGYYRVLVGTTVADEIASVAGAHLSVAGWNRHTPYELVASRACKRLLKLLEGPC